MDPANVANIVEAAGHVNGVFDTLQRHSMAGHFSAVFRARHIPSGQTCALKFLADRGDPHRREAFIREGTLLSTALEAHPTYFVPLVSPPSELRQTATLPNGSTISFAVPYLALEFLPRGTPEVFVHAASGHAELLHRLALVRSMTRVLSRAHYLNLAHRDVKPGNFLLTSRNTVKLNDFGSALAVSAATATYIAPPRGDLRYTAPELLVGLPWPADVVFGADIYSLGCTAFELITGQPLVAHGVFGGGLGRIAWFRGLMAQFSPDTRVAKYHEFLGRRDPRVPDIRLINPDLPSCSYPPIKALLEALCHFDYRYRERSFERIQRLIQIATLVVSNDLRAITRARTRKARRQVPP